MWRLVVGDVVESVGWIETNLQSVGWIGVDRWCYGGGGFGMGFLRCGFMMACGGASLLGLWFFFFGGGFTGGGGGV